MKKKNVIIAGGIIFLAVCSLYFDNLLAKGIFMIRNPILDKLFLFISFLSSEVIVFSILTIIFLIKEKRRKWLPALWASAGISVVISFILKIMIQRERPFQLGLSEILPTLNDASFSLWNFSFPSFETMLAFCAIPIIAEHFPKMKKIWIIFAIAVGISRFYLGLHFLSDVIIGGLIGYLIGFVVVKKEDEDKLGHRLYERIFKK